MGTPFGHAGGEDYPRACIRIPEAAAVGSADGKQQPTIVEDLRIGSPGVRLPQWRPWALARRRSQRTVMGPLHVQGLPAKSIRGRSHRAAWKESAGRCPRRRDRQGGDSKAEILIPYAAPYPCIYPGCSTFMHGRRCQEPRAHPK